MNTRNVPLPDGWRLGVQESAEECWIHLHGPQGQGAAFRADRSSVRGEVLAQFIMPLMAVGFDDTYPDALRPLWASQSDASGGADGG